MIGLLIGKPLIDAQKMIIVVNGVGYEVNAGGRLLSAAALAESITAYIYTHVRENAIELYGFQTAQEKNLFLLLLEVSGIGPKTALAIADQGAEQITEAVQNANVSFFSKLPRVGKKLAQKIIIELKSKLGSLKELKMGGLNEHEQLVFDAVVALGFDEQKVYEVLETVSVTEIPLEQAVKEILRTIK